MTLQIKENERTQTEWNRKARDAVNALIKRTLGTGATAARPENPTSGQFYYDETLKKPIWWNKADARWKDAAGTNV